MTSRVLKVQRNEAGRDLIVGDIHGQFSKLHSQLHSIGFNPSKDRLFSVGDLVDRGPESDQALLYLAHPWFFAVAGNHEAMAIEYVRGDIPADLYIANGGAWNAYSTMGEQRDVADTFSTLPIAIELDTPTGPIGITHANCPNDDWRDFLAAIEDNDEHLIACAQWDRSRIEFNSGGIVRNVRAVVVGHTPVSYPTWLGNVLHIDSGAYLGGPLFIIDAATLESV